MLRLLLPLLSIGLGLVAPSSLPASPAHATDAAATAQAEQDASVPVPQPSEKALRYYRSGNVLWAVGQIWGLAVPLGLLATGFSARMRNWARTIGRRWFFEILVYFLLFSLVTYLVNLPLAFYAGYLRPHAYDLSNLTLGKWFSDSLKALAVGIVAGGLLLWIPYLLLRVSPRRWWLYTGLVAVPVIVLATLIAPIWIQPLFNRFGPMKDRQLEAEILALADRAGIEGGRVFEVAKSEDTKAVNAYVTGLGNTKRIVLWDTLLARLEPAEVRFIMGHEMAHYVLNHIPKGIALGSLGLFVSLYFVYRSSGWLIRRYQPRFGFHDLADVASLPLILLLIEIVSLAASPAMLAWSRSIERESDRFGLELTQDNRAAANAFAKLQQENLANPRPGPWFVFWRASHPPLGERIEFANAYRPWQRGEPLHYGRYFQEPY